MKNKLSSYFSCKAGAALLSGAMLGSCASLAGVQPEQPAGNDNLDISRLVPSGRQCVLLSKVNNPGTPVEHYLARQFSDLQRTKTGRMLFDPAEPAPIEVCYDRALDKEDVCGFFLYGQYSGSLVLNPAERVNEKKRTATAVHEMRHRFQKSLGLDYGAGLNVQERERVVLYWLTEADARLASILYAFEKAEQGDDSYMRSLHDDQKMINAFYRTLNPDKTNVAEAARASMLAFLEQRNFLNDYANSTLDWVDGNKRGFNPEQAATMLLESEKLSKMGEIGYGNYMTGDVIETFNKAFSAELYQSLKTARTLKGGRVCKL